MAREVALRRGAFIDSLSVPPGTLTEIVTGRVLRPWIARRQRAALASFDDALSIAREEWPRKHVRASELDQRYADAFRARGRPGFFDRLVPFEHFGLLTMPSISQTGRDLAIRRVALVTLAVERYRRDHGNTLPGSLTALVPKDFAERWNVIPFALELDLLTVAIADPAELDFKPELTQRNGLAVTEVVATPQDIARAFTLLYGA